MRKVIHHLRRQPEEVRRHVLHIITVVAAILLLMLWVFSLGRNLGSKETQTRVREDVKPLSALKANLIGGYQNITEPDPYAFE